MLIVTPLALQETGPDEERVTVEPLPPPASAAATAPKSTTAPGPRASSAALGAVSKPACPTRS